MLSLIRLQAAEKFNRTLAATVGILLVGMHPSALIVASAALPSGEQVVSGDVSFVRNGSELTITQGSQSAIINWDDFSIGSGALTQFIQNGTDAAALNRVVTLNPSLINGTLSANGQVFLINPNGITVGPGGVIDTASFIGSTLDVTNEDFLQGGDLNFFGDSSAAITNLGSISADAGVFLFAQQIDNQGQLVSANQVGLATGSRILLQPMGEDGRVSVLLGTTDDGELDGDAIRNSGEVEAAMVTMEATGSAYSTAVNNEGLVRAQNFDTSGGRVRLTGMGGDVRNSGTIDASGSTGGEVVVTGEGVYLTGDSVIDASGDFGGGSVKVGGGLLGQDATVENATNVFLAEDASISADALISGSGGEIITFAEGQAIILGTLSAQGADGGSGGFVETSGLEYFVIAKNPLIGAGGEWLIDPNNIEIVAGGGNTNINAADPFESTDDSAQLGVDLIVAALMGGSDVTVTTGSGGADSELGNITLATDLNYDTTGAATLTFDAANNITIDGAIFDSTPGLENLGLTLLAGGDININDDIDLNGGDFTATASSGFYNHAFGTLDAGVVDITADADVQIADTNAGSFSAVSTNNLISINGNLNVTNDTFLSSEIQTGQLLGLSTLSTDGLRTGGNGTVLLNETSNTINTFASTTNANVTLTNSQDLDIGTVDSVSGVNLSGNSLTLNVAGQLTQSNSIQASNVDISALNTIDLSGSSNNQITGTFTADITNAGQDLLLDNTVATELGAISMAGGNFTVNSLDAITQTGTLDLTTTTTSLKTQNNAGAAITLNDTANEFGTLSAQVRDLADANNATADISLASNNGFVFETLATDGNVALDSAGLVTQTATSTLDILGELSIDTEDFTGAGDVSFTQTGDVIFSGDTIVQGDLIVTTTTGGANVVQDSGSTVSVAGTLDANAGLGGSVTLTDPDNVINSLNASDGSVFIRQVGDVDIDGTLVTGPIGGNLTVIALDEGNEFAGAAVNGTDAVQLDVGGASNSVGSINFVTENSGFNTATALSNNITQSVLLDVDGTSSFSSAGTIVGNITLNDPTNDFGGRISASGATITIVDSSDTLLGGINASTGNLSVTSDGAITQSVGTILNVAGTSNFSSTGTGAITLSEDNLLTGAISIDQDSAENVSVNNDQALVLGNIDLSNPSSDLNFSSNAGITQAAATGITMAGGTLSMNVGDDVSLLENNSLANLGNVFVTGDFALAESDGFTMDGTVDVGVNNVSLSTTGGGINQTNGSITAGGLEVTGTGTFDLSRPGNDVDTLAADTTGAITFVDADDLELGAVGATTGVATNGGNLDVTASTGNLTVEEAITPGTGDVSLESTVGLLVQGTSGSLDMDGGTANLNVGAGGAVGSSGTPIVTSGSHTLNASPTALGGVFVENNTVAGDVILDAVNPANGAIRISNLVGDLTVQGTLDSGLLNTVELSASDELSVDAAVDGTTINLTSGTTMALGADVGGGLTTDVTIDNSGLLTRTGGTVNALTDITLQGTGDVTSGGPVDTLVTATPLVILNKATSGAVFVRDTAGNLSLQGTINDTLGASSSNDILVPVGQNLTNNSTELTALVAAGSINSVANAGDVALAGGGLWLRAGTSIGNSAVDLMDFSNAGILSARAAGPIFLNSSAGDFEVGTLDASTFSGVNPFFAAQSGITTTTAGQTIGLTSASGTIITVTDNVTTAGGNISIVVDAPGGTPNGLIIDGLVSSGGTGGGSYTIGGGVLINTNPIATTGTNITLDGGGQDIIISTDQSYAGAVSFQAPGDILIQALLEATGSNGNITLVSDADLDDVGGIRVYDAGTTTGQVRASRLISMIGSDLDQSGAGDFDAIVLDTGANRVVSAGTVQAIDLDTTASADARNILIGGNIVASNTGTTTIASQGGIDSNILIDGNITASQIAATNTLDILSPGTVELNGTIATSSTSNNAVSIDNDGALTVDGGLITAANNGGVSLSGAGAVATGVGGDVLTTQDVGRFTFNKAGQNVFINQTLGDATIQGVVGGLVLSTPAGSISNSAALTADRVTLDATGDISLTSSNNISRFVNAVGATGMSINLQNNAITTFGDFSYTAAGGSDLTLGESTATAPFGTSGAIAVTGDTSFNLLAGTTNFTQLENSLITGGDITFDISGTGSFASNVGDFSTGQITINNGGAVTRDSVTEPIFTASDSITLEGVGSVGTLADSLLVNTSRLTLNKPSALDDGSGDSFVDQIAIGGNLLLGGTSGGSVTVNMLGLGQSINQDTSLNIGPGGPGGSASAGPLAANNTNATLSLSTAGGDVNLDGNGNRVRNFGSINVVDGSFNYTGQLGASGVETRFTENVSVTGIGAGINIVYGGNVANRRDLVIENGVSFLSDGDVLISRSQNTAAADGTVYLGGDITTNNDSDIEFRTLAVNDANFTPVILTNDVVLTTNSSALNAGNVNFDGPVSSATPNTNDLTVNAGQGDIYFNDLVGGAAGVARIGDLTANSGGDTTFNDQVFATNVTTDAGGTTFLVFDNAGGFAVDTTEDQEYNDSVLLVNDIDLRSDSDVTFNGTVDSSTAVEADARNLYVEASGVTSFNDNVGVTNFLETVETDAPGSVAINDNDIAAGITIRTRGTQTYGADAGIIVGGGTTGPNTLTTHTGASDSIPGDILLNGGLDGKTAGVNDLLLIAGDVSDASITGDIVFDGAGGATTEMGDIVIRVADNVDVNGLIASTTFLQEAGLSTTTLNGSITTSSASTPGFASAPIVAGGGIQIFANSITVNDDLQANNNGRILLNSGTDLFIVETTVETTGTTTANAAVNNRIDLIAADDVIVGSPFQGAATTVQTGNGAINIEAGNSVASGIFEGQGVVIAGNAANLTLVSAGGNDNGTVTITADSNDSSDILVNSATVEATGIIASATQPAITFTAADDIVIGDFNADAVSIVQTTNGAIRFTASNGTSPDSLGENADGILIEGSGTNGETGIVIARGVENGDIDFNALDRASVEVRGGDFAISSAIVDAADDMTIDIEDGDLMVRGGFGADSAARVTSAGTQTINLTEGNMSVMGGNAANTLALVGADETQEITLTDGSLTVTGGFGDASLATITLSGDANQTITVELGDVSLSGGSGDATGAGIVLDGDGQQTVIIGNDVDDGLGNLSIQGGSGEQAFAGISHGSPFSLSGINTGVQVIEVDNNVDITGGTGDQALAGILHAGIGDQSVTLGGNTASAGDGDLNITGGDGIGASAAIIAGSAELQDVILQGGSITIQGNLDSANAGGAAGIVSQSSTTTQTINVSGGSDIFLIGGSGDDDLAQIFSGGIQDIDATGIISLTGGSGTGTGSYAEIRAVGNQSILAENNANLATAITIQGGSSTGADDYALIVGGTDGTSTQTIITSQGDIVLSGLEGNSSGTLDSSISEFGAGIINNGLAQTITLNGDGDLSLTGGAIGESAAAIEMTNANGIQDIDVGTTSGSLTLNGGTGADAYALIRSLGTVASAQSIQVQDDITLNGNAATSSFAINGQNIGAAISSVGPQDIDTLTVGSISLTGGTVDNSAALISANDTQTVTINDEGDLTITGGSGNTSSAGILLVGDADQTVDVLLGDAALQGGAGDNSSAGIQLVGNGLQTVTVGNDTADGDGNLSITGGAGDFAFAGIENTGAGDQFVNADNNVTLLGGTGDTTNAAIHQSGSGDQFVTLGGAGGDLVGDLSITGGNGNDADAYILANGADVQTVTVQEGSLSVTGNQDATNDLSEAYIQSFSAGTTQTVDVSSSDVTSGNITLQAGTGNDERARILSGNIQDIDATGVLSMTGGNGAAAQSGSFADIRANATQTINVVNSNDNAVAINIQGGSSDGADDYALIVGGTDDTATQTIATTRGDIVLAGNAGNSSVPVDSSTTEFGAGIINNGLAQTITINGAGDLSLTGGTIDDSAALIEMTNVAANATQSITVGVDSGDLLLNGGTGEDAYALIRSQGTGVTGADIAQVIQVQDSITLNGNSATSSELLDSQSVGAAIVSDGTQDIDTLTDGSITLTGGDVTASGALVASTSLTGDQTIDVNGAGNLSVLGGVGGIADAIVRGAGLNQSIVVTDGNLLLDAGDATNSDSDALIAATNTGAALQFIDVEGTISVLGGDGGNETAAITAAGYDSSFGRAQDINALSGILIQAGDANAGNDALIESFGLQSQQLIIVQNNNLEIFGGSGSGQSAFIRAAGVNDSFNSATGDEAAQRIDVQSGNLIVDADPTSSSAVGNLAFIESTNTDEASQYITVNGTTEVLGGDGGGDFAWIRSSGFDSSIGLAQTLISQQAVTLQSGDAGGGDASIESFGSQGRQLIDVINGDLSVISGNGGGNQTFIRTAGLNQGFNALTGLNAAQRISVRAGNLIVDADPNGTTGGGASAFIESLNTGTASQYITVNGTTDVLAGDAGGNEAYIRANGFDASLGLAQALISQQAVTIQSGDAGGGNAFIQSTGSEGSQFISVATGDLSILSGSGGGNQAYIRTSGLNEAGGQLAQTVVVEDGNLLIDAFSGTGGTQAFIDSTNDGDATQRIEVQGTASVLAGDNGGELAFIRSAGYDGAQGLAQDIFIRDGLLIEGGADTGGNDATIETTGLQGRQAIVVESGGIQILGGSGAGQESGIFNAGINGPSGEFAQFIQIQAGDLFMDAGDNVAAGTSVNIVASNTGEASQVIEVQSGAISILGGDGDNEIAQITSAGFDGSQGPAQSIFALNDIRIEGGEGTSSEALILATGTQGRQLIITQTGDFSVLAGSGEAASARVEASGLNGAGASQQAQRILVQDGNMILDAGNGLNANANALVSALNSGEATQFIDVNGTLTLQGGDGLSERAEILAQGFDATPGLAQSVTATGDVSLTGGLGNDSLAGINSTGSQGRQVVTTTTGDLTLLGGDGIDAEAQITANGTDGAGLNEQAQRILVQSGALTMSASAAVNGGDATIDSFSANQSQFIDVDGTPAPAGTLTVNGGASGTVARISSAGAQDIEVENEIDINALLAESDVDITAADTQNITSENADIDVVATGTDATVDITAGLAQTIDAATSIDIEAANDADVVVQNTLGNQELLAGTDITVDADSAATVLIQADDGTQTLTAGGLIDLNSNNVDTDITINSAAGPQDIDADTTSITMTATDLASINVTAAEAQSLDAVTSIDMVANTDGDIVVQNTLGDQELLAGTDITVDADSAATVLIQADDGTQTLTAGGLIDLNSNNLNTDITINSAAGPQDIDADTTSITMTATDLASINVTAAEAQSLDAATSIDMVANTDGDIVVQNTLGDQELLAGTDITVDADSAATVLVQADAGQQTITAQDLIDINADAANTDVTFNSLSAGQAIEAVNESITITATDQSNIELSAQTTQTIDAETLIDVNADNATILAESRTADQAIIAETGDITIDAVDTALIEILAATEQAIAATAEDIAITSNTDSDVVIQNTLGNQDLTAGTDITVDADSAGTVLAQADDGIQTLTAGGLIDLNSNNLNTDITINSLAGPQDIDADGTSITMTATDEAAINVTAAEAQSLDAVTSIDMVANTDGDIVVQNTLGDQELLAGTDITVDADSAATVLVQADDGLQTFTADNLIDVNADGLGTSVTFDSLTAAQDVNATNANITLTADNDADIALTADTNQTVDANTFIDVDAANSGNVLLEARTGTQDITAATGDITLNVTDNDDIQILAGAAQAIDATLGSILATVATGGITIQNDSGTQDLTAGTDIVIDVTDGAATIEATDGDQSLLAVGDIDVDVDNGLVRIESVTSEQSLIADNGDITFDGINGVNISALAGSNQLLEATSGAITGTVNNGSLTIQNDTGTQMLDADSDIALNITNGAILVEATDGAQTLTAGNAIDLDAALANLTIESVTSTQDLTAEQGDLTINLTNSNGSILAALAQSLEASNGSILGSVTGGGLTIQNTSDAQTLTAGSDIAFDVTSGAGLIEALNGTQTLSANGSVDFDAEAGSLVVNSNASTQDITAATGDITLDALNNGTVNVFAALAQTIDATLGSLLGTSAGNSAITIQNTGDPQTLTADMEIGLDASGTSTILVEALAGTQSLTGGVIDLDADGVGSLVRINSDGDTQLIDAADSTFTASANNGSVVDLTAADEQTLSADSSLALEALNGSNLFVQNTTNDQNLTAGTDLSANATAGSTLLVEAAAGTQNLTAGSNIDLSADGAGSTTTVRSTSGDQVVTSTGTTDLSGTNDGATLLTAINSTLNNAGGVLTDDAVIGSTGTTETVTINNSGALTVADVDPAHIHVNADTAAATVTLTGAGTIGATGANERLVTNTDTLAFNDAAKTANLDERVGAVTIEGVIDALDLILSDTGDLTDSAAFTANTATLQTSDGTIDLSTNAITVAEFAGLIANNGDLILSLIGDSILGNRALSTDIPAGEGVFADANIDLTSADTITIAADEVLSSSGDLSVDAAALIFDAENGSTGGVNGSVGAVGTVTTDDGMQTYNAPITFATNTLMSASGASDDIIFNEAMIGPGGLEIGSTPIFNAAIGSIDNPLAYLILNSTGTAQFNFAGQVDPDTLTGSDTLATAIIGGSFLNNGTMEFTDNATIIVDAATLGTESNPDAVFQGGIINGLDGVMGNFELTLFAGAIDSVSALSGLPNYPELYASWQIDPSTGLFAYQGTEIFQPNTVFFRDPLNSPVERDKERFRRVGQKKSAEVDYDGTTQTGLAGSLPNQTGRAGGLEASSFDDVDPNAAVSQILFGDVVILP